MPAWMTPVWCEAHLRFALENRHSAVRVTALQLARGCEPGDAGADHSDVAAARRGHRRQRSETWPRGAPGHDGLELALTGLSRHEEAQSPGAGHVKVYSEMSKKTRTRLCAPG